MLREILDALVQATVETLREVKHVSTRVEDAIARLKAVQSKQDKTLGEIAATKTQVAALQTEVSDLKAVIAGMSDVPTPEELAALNDAVTAVEQRAGAIDEALPDLPDTGTSPTEGTGTDTGSDAGATGSTDTGADAGTDTGASAGAVDTGAGDAAVETGAAVKPTPFK